MAASPSPAGFEHVAGETLFFSCRIAGYAKTPEEKVHVAYSVQAFDPKGVPLTEIYKNEMMTDVTPQDKEWMPKIATEIQIPPLVGAGHVQDRGQDRGHGGEDQGRTQRAVSRSAVKTVEPSDTLVVRNCRVLPRRGGRAAASRRPVYRRGDAVWAKFDIIGFKYGEKNHIDVSYVTSVLAPSGKVLWTQPEPAVEQSESFYPKRYVAATDGDYAAAHDQARRVHHRAYRERHYR